jgi:hypothetical protein
VRRANREIKMRKSVRLERESKERCKYHGLKCDELGTKLQYCFHGRTFKISYHILTSAMTQFWNKNCLDSISCYILHNIYFNEKKIGLEKLSKVHCHTMHHDQENHIWLFICLVHTFSHSLMLLL